MNLPTHTLAPGREAMTIDWMGLGGLIAGIGALGVSALRRVRQDGGESVKLEALEKRVDKIETKQDQLVASVAAYGALGKEIADLRTLIEKSLAKMEETIEKIAPRQIAEPQRPARRARE